MLQSKKFNLYALALVIVCLVYMFLGAALESGGRELAPRFAAAADWTDDMVRMPVAVGNWLAVAGILLGGLLLYKCGPRMGLAAGSALGALGCLAVAAAGGGNGYWLYTAGQCLLPWAAAMIRLGAAGLAVSWFARLRGRALGLISLGGGLYSAIGGSAVAQLITDRLGGAMGPLAAGAAAALGLAAVCACFLLRDTPEETGMYPDGAGRPPEGEPEEDEPWPTGLVLRSWRVWAALVSLGALAAVAAGWMSFLAPRLMARHGGGDALVVLAGPWLALGAIFALPVGYLFGWLGDRLGAMNAVRLLGLGEAAAVCVLWFFPKELGAVEGICLCAASALLMGAAPVVIYSAIAQVCGRRQYLSVGRVLFPALALAAVLTGPAGALLGGGERARLYIGLLALTGLGVLTSFFLQPEKKQ